MDALGLIQLEATSSYEQNLEAFRRHRKIVAGMLERCKKLDARIERLLGNNQHLLGQQARARTRFEARIAELEAEVQRLERLAASQASEIVDTTERVDALNNVIRRLNIEFLENIRDFDAQVARLAEAQDALESSRQETEASRRESTDLRAEIAELQDEVEQLHAGRAELEHLFRQRQAQLEVHNLILRLTLENITRRRVMANEANHEPEEQTEAPGWKKFMLGLVIVVAGLLAAFLFDKYASHGIWMGLEISVALVALLITVFSRQPAYQGSALVIGGGPGRTFKVENLQDRPADPAGALAEKERAKAAAEQAVNDHLPALTAAREALRIKTEALTTATAALHAAALIPGKPEAEMAPLRTAVQTAQAEKDAAQAALPPIETRHTELTTAATAANEAFVHARDNQPKKPTVDWKIRPVSILAMVMALLVVLYDGVLDGNRFVRDGFEPRGCDLPWLTSEDTIPTKRIVVNDLPGVREVYGLRLVEDGRGGVIHTITEERFDGKPVNADSRFRIEPKPGK